MVEDQSLISENKIEKNVILVEKWRFYVMPEVKVPS